MYKRCISLDISKSRSCFLWGARQSGKSTLLRHLFPKSIRYDLLLADEFRRLTSDPTTLRQEIEAQGLNGSNQTDPVIIDEVQKVPGLLDEIHWLIENRGLRFILCGSSARKIRRTHANLLGGRAPSLHLHSLVSREIPDFNLEQALNRGLLPPHYVSRDARLLCDAYIGNYLREEVAAEASVRNLPAFARFLDVAALSNGEVMNYDNIARECGVSSPTIKAYFEVLTDTLLGEFVHAFTKRAKRRVVQSPRFYFFDVGITGALTRRGAVAAGSELWGRAFEHFIFMELAAHRDYQRSAPLAYWRTSSQFEVDFILDDGAVAVEVKSTSHARDHDLRGLRAFKDEHQPRRSILVSMDAKPRKTDDGIEVMPWARFFEALWSGNLHK